MYVLHGFDDAWKLAKESVGQLAPDSGPFVHNAQPANIEKLITIRKKKKKKWGRFPVFLRYLEKKFAERRKWTFRQVGGRGGGAAGQ